MSNSSTSTTAEKTSLSQSYDQYYDCGLYDARYPRPNHNVLKFVLNTLRHNQSHLSTTVGSDTFLDYGCGNGRYLLPLLKHCDWHAMAFDISDQAISQLTQRLNQEQLSSRCHIIEQWPQPQKYKVALMLYGVLGHIKTHKQRVDLLTQIHQQLTSTLIISVPNIQRRFITRNLFSSKLADIEYQRTHNKQQMHFHYHLYSLTELLQELTQSGFRISKIKAESMLPEKWITNSFILRAIDRFLCKVLPVQWAYGILVSARHA